MKYENNMYVPWAYLINDTTSTHMESGSARTSYREALKIERLQRGKQVNMRHDEETRYRLT